MCDAGGSGVCLLAVCVVVTACVTDRRCEAVCVRACVHVGRLHRPVENRSLSLLSKHPYEYSWDGVLVLSPLHARRETSGRKLERRGEADASRHPGSWPKMGRYPSRTDIGPMKWVTPEVVVLGGAH